MLRLRPLNRPVLLLALLPACAIGCRSASGTSLSPADTPAALRTPDQLTADVREVASRIAPLVPDHWTVTSRGPEVLITRDEEVEVYNLTSVPSAQFFTSNEAYRQYRRQRVFKTQFQLTLAVGQHMPLKEHRRLRDNNEAARKWAGSIYSDRQVLGDFLLTHPEYGYRPLPTLYTSTYSIYRRKSVEGALACFDEQIQAECISVVLGVSRMFQAYEPRSHEHW